MKHAAILGLSIRHPFYDDERCPDFAIQPSPATERLVRNHRLVVRTRPDGVQVVTPLGEQDAMFVPFSPGATLDWHLRLRNPGFARFTDLGALAALDAPVYTRPPAAAAEEHLVLGEHPAPETVPAGVFATVSIGYGAPATPAAGGYREFVVGFTAAEARWSYYCITDLAPESGPFTVVDTAADPISFGAAEDTPTDLVGTQLAAMYPAQRRLRFLSDDLVASRQTPRKKLELRLDDQRVVAPLPNPAPAAQATVEVTVNGNQEEQALLYEVVKYPDRPPANNGG